MKISLARWLLIKKIKLMLYSNKCKLTVFVENFNIFDNMGGWK